MTEKKKKSSAILQSLKKGARSLLSGKKDLDKLAAGLAVTAILAEEVQAAQKKQTLDPSNSPALDKDQAVSNALESIASGQPGDAAQSTENNVLVDPLASDATQTTPSARAAFGAVLQDELANTQTMAQAYPITPDAARLAMRNVIDDEVNATIAKADEETSAPKAVAQIPELTPVSSFPSLASLAPGLLLGGFGGGGSGIQVAGLNLGYVADGYLQDAKVYRDDGTGKPLNGVYLFTDAKGGFDLSKLPPGSGKIVAEGVFKFVDASGVSHTTTDTSTHLNFTVKLYAPSGASVINPLTTLVQTYVEKLGLTADAAGLVVSKALGLVGNVNLLTYDPLSIAGNAGASAADVASAIANQIKAAQVANLMVTGAVAVAATGSGDAQAAGADVLAQLVKLISEVGTGQLNLADSTTLANILTHVASNVIELIAAGNNISATTLKSIYEYQKVVQDDISQAATSGLVGESFNALKHLLSVVASGQKVVDIRLAEGSDSGISSTDALTKFANPFIHVDLTQLNGTVVVGNQVEVMFGDVVAYRGVITQAQLDQGSVTFSFADLGSDGAKSLAVVITDTVTLKPLASGFMAFTLDTHAPTAPSFAQTAIAGDDIINIVEAAQGVTISGKADAGTQIELRIAGQVIPVDTAVQSDGSLVWTCTLAPKDIQALGQLSNADVQVFSTDKAGNVSASALHSLSVDTLSPELDISARSNNTINLELAKAGVVLQGAASPGATVVVQVGALEAVSVVSGNHWTLTLNSTQLAAALNSASATGGSVNVTVTATDAAGNSTSIQGPQLWVDLKAPDAPVIVAITGVNLSGHGAADLMVTPADAASGVTISGRAEAGSIVALSIQEHAIEVVRSGEVWTATLSATQLKALQGQVTLHVQTTDAVGNVSQVTSQPITLATIAPDAPSVLTPITEGHASSNIINASQAAQGIVLTGAAPANTSLSFSVDGQSPLSIAAGNLVRSDTVWTLKLTPEQIAQLGDTTPGHSHQLLVTATDVYGNATVSEPVNFVVDTALPAVAMAAGLVEGTTLNAAQAALLTLQGTAEAGSLVKVLVQDAQGVVLQTLNAQLTDGNWSLPLSKNLVDTFGQGAHRLVVQSTDAAGNVATTVPLNFTVDTVEPGTPTLTRPVAGDNTINAVESQGGVLLTGTFELGSVPQVEFSLGNKSVTYASDRVTTQGTTWSLNLSTDDVAALGQGQFDVKVKSLDPAGNPSQVISAKVTIDTLVDAPKASPEITGQVSELDGSITRYANSGLVKVGLESADATWEYKVNGGAWKTGTGTSLTVTGDGAKTILIHQTDAAGNTSADASLSFTLDTTVAAPVLALVEDTGSSQSDNITQNGTVFFANLEAHATAVWQYAKNNGPLVDIDATGNTVNFKDFGDGLYTVYVRQLDVAGNISQQTSTSFKVDTTAPTLTLHAVSDDHVLSTAEAQSDLVITGQTDAEAGQVVTLFVSDGKTVLFQFEGIVSGGTWSVTVPASDVASFNSSITYHFSASVSDAAGNVVQDIPSNTLSDDLALAVTNSGLDGYITGATVFVDNKAVSKGGHVGVLDAGEAVSLTDAVGAFSLPANGPLVMLGGVDVSTGLDFQSKYEASQGYRVINPVTTLIREYEIANSVSTDAAVVWVKQLGLLGSGPTSNPELGTYDPFRAATAEDTTSADPVVVAQVAAARAEAISYQKVAAELSNVMDVGAATLQILITQAGSTIDPLTLRQDLSVALIGQIAKHADTTDLAHALADASAGNLVWTALNEVGKAYALDTIALAKLDPVATALVQVNAHIERVASTGTLDSSTEAVTALADIIRAQAVVRGEWVEAKLLDYVSGKTTTWTAIDDGALSDAIAAAPVGMIVPARVSVASVVPGVNDQFAQFEGNDGAHTPFTITLTRAGNIESVVTLDYKVNLGLGMTAADFVGGVIPRGSVTFAAGQSTVDVLVMVQGDNIKELDEKFGVVITDPLGQTQFFNGTEQVSFLARSFTVLNDDPFVPQVTGPLALDLGTGVETSLSAFSFDYYKPTQVLTVKITTVASAVFGGTGIAIAHPVAVDGNVQVMTLTGTLKDINSALAKLTLKVPNSQDKAFVLMDATDGVVQPDGQVLHGTTEVAVTLHHPAELITAALPTSAVAGAITPITGFSVSDMDGGVLTVTLNPTNMTLQVADVAGLATTSLDNGGLTLVGTAANINLALASLNFTASAGDIKLSASVTDSDVYSVKSAPVALSGHAMPAPTVLDAPSFLTGSAGNPMSVSGLNVSDLDSKSVKVDITASHGTLSLSAATGVDVRQIDATHYTVAGRLDDVNSALQNLTFTGEKAGVSGTITITAQDPAQAGLADAPALASQTITVDVLSRAAPQAGGDINFRTVTGFAPVVEDATLTTLKGLVVNNLHADAGQIPTQVRILSVTGGTLYDLNGNPITLGAAGTLITLNSAHEIGLKISPDLNRNADIKISYAVADTVYSSLNSLPSTFVLPIQAVNDAPVIAPNSGLFVYTEDAAAVQILSTLQVSDVDSTNLKSATVTISNYFEGDKLAIDLGASGLAVDTLTPGKLVLSGSASLATYQSVLSSLTFKTNSQNPNTETRNITLRVTDADGASSDPVVRTVSVVSVNDAPTLTAPTSA
uniref:Ig-like domain-containing protein n=1 Tax=Limnohabitans sp. TaxID=1907725 RepID=UPI0038BBD03F